MRSNPKRLHRQRSQVDSKLGKLRTALERAAPPRAGWLRAIRESLGMPAEQLGARLGISKQALLKLEEGERRKSITMKSLERAAQAMGCRVLYAIVPVRSLESLLDQRAKVVARRRLERVAHSMALEAQELPSKRLEQQVNELAKEIKQKLGPELWNDR